MAKISWTGKAAHNLDVFHGTQEFLSLLQKLLHPESGNTGQLHGTDQALTAGLFRQNAPVYVSRAPGRLDVMGGIADYSGSLVLQLPLQEACFAAVQIDRNAAAGGYVRVVSLHADDQRTPCHTLPVTTLYPYGRPLPLYDAQKLFKRKDQQGVLLFLHNLTLHPQGLPHIAGKGVSSSASIEVATMAALLAALGVADRVDGRQLSLMCQRVENAIVGAPCGIMDQMSSALGQSSQLLALLCQPAEVQGCVPLPDHLAVWGIDSGVRHCVGGSDYTAVRTGTFMGLKIAQAAQKARQQVQQDYTGESRQPVNAHLVQFSPSKYAEWLQDVLPSCMHGEVFLRTYVQHIDTVTVVDPDQQYAIRQPAAHAIHEHARVRLFRQLLLTPPSQEQGQLLGELMFQSHASYGACGLGSAGTDRIVQLVRQHIEQARRAGKQPVLYGAKITGGGCGGTVCVLGDASPAAQVAVHDIARRCWAEQAMPGTARVFSGSSGGAMDFGHLVVVANL